jgi:hypothetical protein
MLIMLDEVLQVHSFFSAFPRKYIVSRSQIGTGHGIRVVGTWSLGRGMPIIFFLFGLPVVNGKATGRSRWRGWEVGTGGTVAAAPRASLQKRSSFNRRASRRVLGFVRSVVYTRRKLTAC